MPTLHVYMEECDGCNLTSVHVSEEVRHYSHPQFLLYVWYN